MIQGAKQCQLTLLSHTDIAQGVHRTLATTGVQRIIILTVEIGLMVTENKGGQHQEIESLLTDISRCFNSCIYTQLAS